MAALTAEELQKRYEAASPEQRAGLPKFIASRGTSEGFSYGGDVVQEQHPDITFGDRFAIKNFGGDVQTAVDYLKKEHPGLTVAVRNIDGNQQIIAKKPEEDKWRVLDPEQGFVGSFAHPGEAIKDISDITYDIGSGIASGAATALGGLAGGVGGLGIGALPAAAIAGGATSAGLEGLRQKIGQEIGVHQQNYDPLAIGISGVLGAAAPLLPGGTGASKAAIGRVAEKYAPQILERATESELGNLARPAAGAILGPEELSKAEEILGKSQRGLLSQTGSRLADMLVGVDKRTIESAGEKLSPEMAKSLGLPLGSTGLDAADALEKEGLGDLTAGVSRVVHDNVWSAKQSIQADFTKALSGSNEQINVLKHAKPFIELIQKYEKDPNIPASIQADVRDVINVVRENFAKAPKTVERLVNGKRIATTVYEPIVMVTPDRAMMIRQKIKDLTNNFASTEGKKVYTKDIQNAAARAYHDLGEEIYAVANRADKVSGGAGQLSQRYKALMDVERLVEKRFSTPEKTYQTIRGLNNQSRKQLRVELNNIDKVYGTNIKEAGKLLDVNAVFGNPSYDALSGKGGTSTSRSITGLRGLSSGLAYYLTHAATSSHPLSLLAGAVAGFGGGKIGSPAAIKKMMQTQQAINRFPAKVGIADIMAQLGKKPKIGPVSAADILSAARSGAPVSTWNLMQRGQ